MEVPASTKDQRGTKQYRGFYPTFSAPIDFVVAGATVAREISHDFWIEVYGSRRRRLEEAEDAEEGRKWEEDPICWEVD